MTADRATVATYRNDGLDLHYDVAGRGCDVLCVHGATGTGAFEWSALGARLSDRYRFTMPDLRSHGRSDHRAGAVSIEHVVGDLRTLITHEHLDRPHLIGFSFGAEVVLDLELTEPGTARSLVLLSPGLGQPSTSVPSRDQLQAGWPSSLRRLHRERHSDDHWLEIMLELCERAASRPLLDLDLLASIPCPILLVAGRRDDPRRIRQAEHFASAHDDCRFELIDGGGHAVHKDQPDAVADLVGDFLDGVV